MTKRIIAILSIMTSLAVAQSLTSVSGTVTDSTGAVVPNASLTMENAATNVKRTATSDASGFYQFPQIAPGEYKITAAATGFGTVTIGDVRLLVNSPATVNVRLEVGSIAQSVDVSAEAQQINTTDATIGNAYGARPIMQLPLEGRNVVGLLSLQPGVSFLGENTTSSRSGSVNGGKSDQANVTLDGVDVNDQQDRSAFTSVLRVTLDSVQEFRVTTTNSNADQGRTSGAQVALVTRSGSNEIHGSAYEYHRNTITTANSFFNNAANVPRPKLIRNVFGTSVGGPLQRNKLFFFLNYEGRRDAKDGAANRTVPTETFRQGIIQYQRTDNSIAQLSPAQLRQIDPLGIGPNAGVLKVLQSYPLPNNTSIGNGLNTAGFRFIAPLPVIWNTYIARLDWRPGDSGKHSLFVRGNLQNDSSQSLPQFPGEPANSVDLANSKGLAAGYDIVFKPNFTGAFRYGYTRQGVENSGLQTQSAVSFLGTTDRYGLTTAFVRITPVHNPRQDFSYIKGPHTLQFGATQLLIENSRINFANAFHSAQTRASRLRGSGAGLDPADLNTRARDSYRSDVVDLLGIISTASANYNYNLQGKVQPLGAPVSRRFINREYEFYALDTWRLNRALSVSAGLRYSLMPPLFEADGLQISVSPSLGAWFDQRGGLALQGKPDRDAATLRYIPVGMPGATGLYPFHKKNFAPRFAIAYAPQFDSGWGKWLFGGPGKTAIRAGWGMFYDLYGQSLIRTSDNNSFGLQTSIQSAGSAFTEATAPRFTSLFDLPASLIPAAPAQTFPVDAPASFARGSNIDSTIRPPYSMNMNLTVSREFRHGLFAQIGYVGRLSRRSLIQTDVATPTNLVDPVSGMSYFDAARQLAILSRTNTPVANVPKIAFWENLWAPAAGSGLTATQAIYRKYLNTVDYTTVLEDLDRNCSPACSILGRNALYSPQFASFTAWRSIGNGNYHALQFTLRQRFTQGVEFTMNYTLSKSIDLSSRAERDGTGATFGFVTNPWNPRLNRAVSDYDTLHAFNLNWVAELPFGKGKALLNRGGVVNAIAGGWQLTGLWRQTSGLPISVSNGRNWPTNWQWQGFATPIANVPGVETSRNAPAVTGAGGPNLFRDPAAALKAYDFTLPGDIGQRNGLRGDGYFTIDGGLAKRFTMPYKESHSVQFRWEVFNITNSARFDVSSLSLSLSNQGTFGKYSDVLTSPRVMQFALRYEF